MKADMMELSCYNESGAYKVAKEGFVLLQFAPAVSPRQYDWTHKQVFSLSVWEMGSLLTLGPTDSCEFFHDPFKGRSDEGKVRKVLKVEPTPDGNGHFFNLSVQNRLLNIDESIYIPITKGEFAVVVSTFNKDGPGEPGGQSWTVEWLKFDNSYFNDIKEQRDQDLLVLPIDAALFEDPSFKVYAEKYAEDQEAFFTDYAEAHAKLSNLGAKFDPPEGFSLDEDMGSAPTDEKKDVDPAPAPVDDKNGAAPQPEPFVAANYSYGKVQISVIL